MNQDKQITSMWLFVVIYHIPQREYLVLEKILILIDFLIWQINSMKKLLKITSKSFWVYLFWCILKFSTEKDNP